MKKNAICMICERRYHLLEEAEMCEHSHATVVDLKVTVTISSGDTIVLQQVGRADMPMAMDRAVPGLRSGHCIITGYQYLPRVEAK
jgi:hypothetical protein